MIERADTWSRLSVYAGAAAAHRPGQSYTLADRVEEACAKHSDRPFLHFGDDTITYRDFAARANRVAHWGLRAGLRRGDRVALLMENRPEFIACWVGLARIGVVTSLMNTNVRGEILSHAIHASGARRIIVGEECAGNLAASEGTTLEALEVFIVPGCGGDRRTPSLPYRAVDLGSILADMPVTAPDPSVRSGLTAGDDLLFIFTSGTTGLPKAARVSHMRFLAAGDGMSAVAPLGPEDVIYCVLPLYHGAGGMVVVSSALASGAAIVLARRFSSSRFWQDVRRHRVTVFQYIGEICRYLVSQPPSAADRDHSLRIMIGAGLGRSVWEAFQSRFGVDRILEGWSATEANTGLLNVDNVVGSCGRIPYKEFHNGRLVRFDPETNEHPRDAGGFCIECDPGEVGEFIGRIPADTALGPGRFEGYTSPEETEKKILRDVFEPGDRWYRSGDLLCRDEDDYFYFVDRVGDTYRWKSENVSTLQVEEVLDQFPAVEIANVYGVRVPGMEGRAGMAALVPMAGQEIDGRDLYDFVEDRLPRYAAPLFVRISQEAQVTTTFKLRKTDLQREGYDPSRVGETLLLRDESLRAYVPLTPESLSVNGLPLFEAS
jgi:fatty-acyl-CoA synthase